MFPIFELNGKSQVKTQDIFQANTQDIFFSIESGPRGRSRRERDARSSALAFLIHLKEKISPTMGRGKVSSHVLIIDKESVLIFNKLQFTFSSVLNSSPWIDRRPLLHYLEARRGRRLARPHQPRPRSNTSTRPNNPLQVGMTMNIAPIQENYRTGQ